MKEMSFSKAIENSILEAMKKDERIMIIGEDVHTLRRNLYTQFGSKRVRATPISEAGFVSASVGAAMAGLRPIVEVMLVDFIGVPIDALLNHAAKNYYFSGEKWNVPLVVRASCGGGYGDGGQHMQSLWGWLAHIPGLSVVVPSNPEDAGNLMKTAIEYQHPVIYLEHKLLADDWLDMLGIAGRETIEFERPAAGIRGEVPNTWEALDFGTARIWKSGEDITLVSVGVGVHQCLEVATTLNDENISAEVIDLRFISPLDRNTIVQSVRKTGKLVIVDEDYTTFGLSGEVSAVLLEEDVEFVMRRVGTDHTIPFNHIREKETLPNYKRVYDACTEIL